MDFTTPQTYTEKLSRMIQSETVSSYDESNLDKFYQFHHLLQELFPSLWSKCDFEDYRGSILLRWRGQSSDHPVLFMNHFDVVSTDGVWTHSPFCGEIFDGKLWGRGTLDTKGGLWAMLQAGEELALSGFIPQHDIWFESSCNEETTSLGASHFADLLSSRHIRFDYILDEGGMIKYEPVSGAKGTFAMIGMGERGTSDLRFIAHGIGGHGSSPEKNTPWVRIGQFMAETDKRKVFRAELSEPVCEMFRRLAPSYHGIMRHLYAHPRLFGGIIKRVMSSMAGTAGAMVQSTIAFTMAEGSKGRNVIPTDASVIGNMRVSHHQGFKSSLDAITKLAQKYDIETEVLEEAIDSSLANCHTAEFASLEKAITHAFPDVVPVPYIMLGASDARFMTKLTENCFHFVPFQIDDKQLESIHGLDENVDVSTLAPAVTFYKDLMSQR